MGWLLRASVVFILVGAYLYRPIPDYIENPWFYHAYRASVKLITDLTWCMTFFTATDGRTVLRGVVGKVEDLTSWGPGDGVEAHTAHFAGVEVRVYEPPRESAHSGGGLMYFHGGGFIVASPDGYDNVCGELVRRLGITIVSVRYRKSPEFGRASQMEDIHNASLHFFKHAHKYRVQSNNIGVAGDSAGGNLAGVAALYLRDRGGPERFSYQVLIYPLLQGLDYSLPSYMQNEWHTFFFTTRSSVAGVVVTLIRGMDPWEPYVPASLRYGHVSMKTREKYSKYINWTLIPDDVVFDGYQHPGIGEIDHEICEKLEKGLTDQYHFPLMAKTVKGLPPTLVVTVESDTIRDDGYLYARRLRDEGVPVKHYNSPGGFHGMITFFEGMSSAVKVIDEINDFIAEQLD